MKKSFLSILAVLVFVSGCGQKSEDVALTPVKIVKTIVIESGALGEKRDFPGVVKSSSITNLSFDISGRLVKLPIKEGLKVKKGQLLAQLEPDKQNYKLHSAKADFIEAQADYNRNKQLYAQGVISAAEYQTRKRKYEMAKASLDLAKKELNYTFLRAPFSGTITRKIAENFQYVKQKDTLAVLQDLNNLEIEINVPENLMSCKCDPDDMEFTAVLESNPNVVFDLEFKSKAQQADDATKTYPVKFTVENKEGYVVLPGMTSTVFIKAPGVQEGKVSIPANAIFLNENGEKCVWVVDDANVVSKAQVKINEIKNDKAVVLSGLKNNDRIVISGVHQLLDGDKIKEYERLDLAK